MLAEQNDNNQSECNNEGNKESAKKKRAKTVQTRTQPVKQQRKEEINTARISVQAWTILFIANDYLIH